MGQNKPSPVDLKAVKLPFGGLGLLSRHHHGMHGFPLLVAEHKRTKLFKCISIK